MPTNRFSRVDLAELYYQWLGIPVRDQPANHYRLLGLVLYEDNPNVIEAASDRQMSHIRSYATGPHSFESQQILNELSKAKLCLLNERRKAEYDAGLRSQLAETTMENDPPAQAETTPVRPPPLPVAPPPKAIPVAARPMTYPLPATAETIPVRPSEQRKRTHPEPSTPTTPPPKSPLQILVWGGLGIAALVLLLMFLTHVAHFSITALTDERKENLPAAPKAEPSPTTSTVPKSSSETKVAQLAKTPPPLAIAPFDAAQAKKHQEAWAKHLDRKVVETNSIGMKLVLIPPGEFEMGSTEAEIARAIKQVQDEHLEPALAPNGVEQLEEEGPQHHVRITKPFFLGMHEVTFGQFRRFVEATDYKTQAENEGWGHGWIGNDPTTKPEFNWRNAGDFKQTDDHPVINVTWNDAVAFCEWLSAHEQMKCRLAREGEWEYACRAGTTTAWHFGDQSKAEEHFLHSNKSWGQTQPVGSTPANAFGLFDMHGNVFEFCNDCYDPSYYGHSPPDDPKGALAGHFRPVRGGGNWNHLLLRRSAFRGRIPPSERAWHFGFRVVCEVGGEKSKAETVKTSASVIPGVKSLAATPPPIVAATLAPFLQAWFKADALSLANGQPVHVWHDSSGHGRDLSETAGVFPGGTGTPPTFVAAGGINRRAAVRFDGESGLASSPHNYVDIHGDAAVTIVLLMNLAQIDGHPFNSIFCLGNPIHGGDPGRPLSLMVLIDRGADEEDHALQLAGGWHYNASLGPGSYNGLYNMPLLLTITRTPGPIHSTTKFYLNGTLADNSAVQRPPERNTAPNIQHLGDVGLWMGKATGWCGGIQGDISEAIIYNKALSESERSAVEKHLIEKYRIGKPPPPIAWFKAENNANGSVGSHNGTLQGGASFAAGKVGQAFQFDGKGGYIQIPDSPDWDFGNNDFTIAASVNFTSIQGWNAIVAHDEGGGATSKWIYCYHGGTFALHIQDPAKDSIWLRSIPFALNTNQWYSVAVSKNGNAFTFFVDGIAISTSTSDLAIPTITAPLTIGWAEGEGYFHGLIDETKIYNRALSAAEISP